MLAISDTHLGADHTILGFLQGIDHLWESLRNQFGLAEHELLEIDELILLGDIIDRTVSSVSRLKTHVGSFFGGLIGRIHSKKLVYVPGNHDHTLWTGYRESLYGPKRQHGITGPQGEQLVKAGKACIGRGNASDLMSIFFRYPRETFWRKMNGSSPDFVVANPLYAKQFKSRTYVFAHGTHFRQEFTLPKWLLECFKRLVGLETLAGDPASGKLHALEEWEKLVSPIIDAVWPQHRRGRYSVGAQMYYLFRRLRSCLNQRPVPEKSKVFSRSCLESAPPERIQPLTDERGPMDWGLKRWKKYFLPLVMNYLGVNGIPRDNLTFVYGDSHYGGWGELAFDPAPVRVYNCGSWVVYRATDHPACHVFAVDEKGEEYLIDLSFKDVMVGDKMLLEAAGENPHLGTVGGVLGALTRLGG